MVSKKVNMRDYQIPIWSQTIINKAQNTVYLTLNNTQYSRTIAHLMLNNTQYSRTIAHLMLNNTQYSRTIAGSSVVDHGFAPLSRQTKVYKN
jgi:hypothetical protein